MMENSGDPILSISELKSKTVSGMLWTFIDRFGYLIFQFITNLVLARILSPNEFGVIGLLLIVVNLAMVFVDSGLGTALIQKKNPTSVDYSTIFIANILLGCFIYLIVYIFAPIFAQFFKVPDFALYLKVIGLSIIVDSLIVVPISNFQKNLNFKIIAIIRFISIAVSSIIAIVCAFSGCGVWSLIIQHLMFVFIRLILIYSCFKLKIEFKFSWRSFKELYNYAYKLLISTLLGEAFVELQSAVIGRSFNTSVLGFFTQAKQLQSVPTSTLSRVVNQVSFPTFSVIQESKDDVKLLARKNLKSLIFLNAPLMFFLAVVAKPLIITLYTEKWIESVPIFQALCIGFGVLLIVHQTILLVLKAIGKSGVVLKLQLIKVVLGLMLIYIGIYFYGLNGLLCAIAVNSLFEFFLNGYSISKEIGYTIIEQIRDILPPILISAVVSFLVILVTHSFNFSSIVELLVASPLFLLLYILFSKWLKIKELNMYLSIVRKLLKIKH